MTADLRVLLVIDRVHDLGGAEGSTTLVLNGLHGHGIQFSAVAFDGIHLARRADLERDGARFFEPSGSGWWAQVRCVTAAIRAVQPDLVHATLARSELAARVAGFVTGVPVVTSIVSTPYTADAVRIAPSRRRLEWYRRLDRFLARRAVFRFHSISHAAGLEAQRALGIDADRITVVVRGRDSDALGSRTSERRLRARSMLGIGAEQPLILNVARQDEQKGQSYLLDAFAGVLARNPQAWLVVAGRVGSATPALRDQVDRLALAERVQFLGMRDDVSELLCAADVFAFPSLFEGLGGSLLEAMALGVPIVAFDSPGVSEAVGDAGILVELGNTSALQEALLTVLEDPARCAELAERGRERFAQQFGVERYLNDMLAWYRQTAAAVPAEYRDPLGLLRRGRRVRGDQGASGASDVARRRR